MLLPILGQVAAAAMAKLLRNLVSQNKASVIAPTPRCARSRQFDCPQVRLQQDGYDLDLTYLTNEIIAMGLPASGKESLCAALRCSRAASFG